MKLPRAIPPKVLAAAILCLAVGHPVLAQPEPSAALATLNLDDLLTQLRTCAPASLEGERITKEIATRGPAAFDALLKHFTAHDGFYDPAVTALLSFPKFGDVLLADPRTIQQALQLLPRMKAGAVPALLRLLAAPEEPKRTLALQQLLLIARTCPDESDRQFTPILTAPPEVKPRLLAAQGLVTGLWAKDAQEAVLQQLVHGDAAMTAALLAAVHAKALPLDEAGAAWLKAAQSATDPQVLANLYQAGGALRAEDVPAAVPVLVGAIKNLKPETDPRIREAIPVILATLKRGGKITINALPDLLRTPAARDAAIDLCTQLGADSAPVTSALAALLDAADCPAERKPALLAALAAIGPAGKAALPSVQKITDPALDKAKKHALLMLQDGWTPTAIADWKPTRMRRGKLTPRPSADADFALASEAIDTLRADLEQNPNITPPAVREAGLDGLFARAGDIDNARSAALRRLGRFNPANESLLYGWSAAALLRAGKHDQAADLLTHAIGRYRLALMSDPSVASRLDFADVAIAQVQTGDVEAMLKLVQQLPVNLTRLVIWQGTHQDVDGALETAAAIPYGPQRSNALAAAALAFANANRPQDAIRAYTLALDSVHAAPINESQLVEFAQALALYSDPGVTPAMLRSFYSPDDRDLSVNARVNVIDQMLSRGNVDSALQLILAAPPPDPNLDPQTRLTCLSTYLHPALALSANARRADAKTIIDKTRKELDTLYEAGAKRPAGRDAGFTSQYFNVVAFLAQIYFNLNSPRDATTLLAAASKQLLDNQAAMGPSFSGIAGLMAHQLAQAGNFSQAETLADKMPPGVEAASLWCAIGEQQFAHDGAAAQKSWQKAQAAGTGDQAPQVAQLIANSRARAQAGSPGFTTISVGLGRAGSGQPMPPRGLVGKALEEAAHAIPDPAARIPALVSMAQQFQGDNPQPAPALIERRLPAEYAMLMREAESKLVGNTAENQNLRAQALNVCLLTGQLDALDARIQPFATAVQNGPTQPRSTATAPAPNLNNVAPFILKTLAATQSATGHGADAATWIDTLTDPGLRAQVRFAAIRGLLLRISDVLLADP